MNATYTKEGFVSATVGGIISLGVGVVVVTLMLIFGGTLGGQVYQTSETDIDAITNTTIKSYIKEGIIGAFKGQKQVGTQMPTLVLAVIVIMIMGLVMGMGGMGGSYGGGYYGGAL